MAPAVSDFSVPSHEEKIQQQVIWIYLSISIRTDPS